MGNVHKLSRSRNKLTRLTAAHGISWANSGLTHFACFFLSDIYFIARVKPFMICNLANLNF